MTSNLLKAAFLASVGALAFSAAPVHAAPVASGYVDAWAALGSSSYSDVDNYYYADGDLDYADPSRGHEDYNTLGGDGRAALQWDSGFGVQLDASGSDTNYRHEGDAETTNLAAHVFQRSDDMLWGGFASIGGWEGSRYATLGAEFQEYWNDWTFYGQASWSKGLTNSAAYDHEDSWNFNAQARYFVSSHLLLTGGVGYDVGSSHGDGCCYYAWHEHTNSWNWTLRAEYLLDDLPVSIFGEYDGSHTPYNGHETYTDAPYTYEHYSGHDTNNLFLIGVRLFLNQQDLMTNDRTGASLEDLNPWTGGRVGYGEGD
jgi:hypothetical protein